MINQTIPIKITNKKSIGRADPTCPFSETIDIMIKMDLRTLLR